MIDSKQLGDWGPFQVIAGLEYDQDATLDDYDGFTAKQVHAYKQDDWTFVGLIVSVQFEGVEIGSSSLWGIEYGFIPITDENDVLTRPTEHYDPLDHVLEEWPDVIDEAKEDTVAFLDRLKGAELTHSLVTP